MRSLLPLVLVGVCASCLGNIGDADRAGEGQDGPAADPTESGSSLLSTRRLTKTQIASTLTDVFGVDPAAVEELAEVATDPAKYGETTNEAARREGFVDHDVEALFQASYAFLEPLFLDPAAREALVGCTPDGAADPCVRAYVARVGRALFRRPLASDEIDGYVAVATGAAADLEGDPWAGVTHATAALVQSPSFLYAPEYGEPAPDGGGLRYTSLEMATRLALALTNAAPDAALLDAGEAGELVTTEGVEHQARRLLDSDAGRRGVIQGFFREYLELDTLEGLGKDPTTFPGWSAALARAMRTEVEMVLEDLVFERAAPFESVLVQRTTFVDGQLAAVYGIDWVAAGAPFQEVTIPDTWERVGLLGTGAVLARNAHTLEPSPTLRGRFVRTKLLCGDIPPPPKTVKTEVPPFDPSKPTTKRERLEKLHTTDSSCKSCHGLMDPLGFPLDHFDAVGAYRESENGLTIDATGKLDESTFDGAPEYASVLAGVPRVQACIALELFRYAAGRRETANESAVVTGLAEETTSVADLLVEIALSEPFRRLPVE